MRLAQSSKLYTSNTLYTQKYTERLKDKFNEGNKHLRGGNYEYDRDRCAKILSLYNLLANQYNPSPQEKTKKAKSLRFWTCIEQSTETRGCLKSQRDF